MKREASRARSIDHHSESLSPCDPTARLPIHLLVIATASFAGGLAATPFVIGDTVLFFYNPETLALVHTFALGWITAAIMGVMYRYVPSLAGAPLRFPRLALVQVALFFIGYTGMVTHFALGQWSGVWSAALVVVASVVLFAINIIGCLWKRIGRAATESGIALSVLFLIVAGCVGFLLAFDKARNFLSGGIVSNLAGHADLAAIGWAAMAVCAISYEMAPAFLPPMKTSSRLSVLQIAALATGAAGLAVALFDRSAVAIFPAAIITLALAAYVVMLAHMASSHGAPLSWSMRHLIIGLVFLSIACVLGLILSRIGAQSAIGARLASIYGLCGLLGFFSNVIIGISYNLFPCFVVWARTAQRWPTKSSAEFAIPIHGLFVFSLFNCGIIVVCASFLAASAGVARIGAIITASGGIAYSINSLRILSRAYRPRF